MTWIKVIEEGSADGELKRVYDRIRGTRGRVSNIFLSQSLNLGALEAHLDLYLRLMFGQSTLSRREREMIAVVVSAANNCEYCVTHHSAALGNYVHDISFIETLSRDFRSVQLGLREKAMLEYSWKLTSDPGSITNEDIVRLRLGGFADEEILHVALVASYFNFANRLASGLGVAVEAEGGSGFKY